MLDPLEGDAVMGSRDSLLEPVSTRMSFESPAVCLVLSFGLPTIKQMSASELDISLRSPNLKSIFKLTMV